MLRLFSSPTLICEQWSTPFAPPLKRSSTLPSSSSLRPFDEGGDVRGEFADLQAGDVFGEILRVRADVADAAGGAAPLRVGAPGGLLLPARFEPRGEPALRIFDDDLADLAELAGGDHLARLLHERVAGVVVGEAVEQAGLFHELAELLRLGEIEGRGLVAEDVEAVFERHLRRRKVHVVRRDDDDEVHALVRRQARLRLDHFLEGAVAAVRRKEEVRAGLARTSAGRREGAADEFDLPVDVRRDAMHRADERAASAADHAVTNFSAHMNGRDSGNGRAEARRFLICLEEPVEIPSAEFSSSSSSSSFVLDKASENEDEDEEDGISTGT